MSKASEKAAHRQESIMQAKRLLKPGDTLYFIQRSRSRSGMMRTLDVYVLARGVKRGDGRCPLVYFTGYAATIGGYSRSSGEHYSLRVAGCGFSAENEVTMSVARALWPKGRTINGKHESAGYCLRYDTL